MLVEPDSPGKDSDIRAIHVYGDKWLPRRVHVAMMCMTVQGHWEVGG